MRSVLPAMQVWLSAVLTLIQHSSLRHIQTQKKLETTGAAEIAERDQDHVPEVKANANHVKHQTYFPDESSFCLIYFVIYRHYIFILRTGVVVWSLQSSSKFEVSSYEYVFTTWNVKTACYWVTK